MNQNLLSKRDYVTTSDERAERYRWLSRGTIQRRKSGHYSVICWSAGKHVRLNLHTQNAEEAERRRESLVSNPNACQRAQLQKRWKLERQKSEALERLQPRFIRERAHHEF